MSNQPFEKITKEYLILVPYIKYGNGVYDQDEDHYFDYIESSKKDLEENISKLYKSGKRNIKVVKNIDFNIDIKVEVTEE